MPVLVPILLMQGSPSTTTGRTILDLMAAMSDVCALIAADVELQAIDGRVLTFDAFPLETRKAEGRAGARIVSASSSHMLEDAR